MNNLPSAASHDVFLSYGRNDQAIAKKIANALEKHGFKVWWDPHIIPGEGFVDAIEKAMNEAAGIIVLWSHTSVRSRYVRNEAEYGANQGKLVPIMVDDVDLPWEVSNFQALDLSQWSGNSNDEHFKLLVSSLQKRITDWDPGRLPSATSLQELSPGGVWNRRRLSMLAATVLTIALVVLGVFSLREPAPNHEDLLDVRKLTFAAPVPLTDQGFTRGAGISPDGKFLVYCKKMEGQYSLHLMQIKLGTENVLVPPSPLAIRTPIFSADGNLVFFTRSTSEGGTSLSAPYDLFRVSILGGTPKKIQSGISARRIDCSPDGRRVAFLQSLGDSLHLMTTELDGTKPRRLTSFWGKTGLRVNVAWSNDGRTIFTACPDPETQREKIISVPLDGSPIEDFSKDLWQVVMDLRSLPGNKNLLVAGLPLNQKDNLNLNLWVANPDLEQPIPLTSGSDRIFQGATNQDANLVAYTCYSAVRQLRVLAADHPESYRDLARHRVSKGQVIWMDDGRLLVTQTVGTKKGLVKMTSSGEAATPVVSGENYLSQMDRSPKGTFLAYTVYSGDRSEIFLADGLGDSPRPLTEGLGHSQFPTFSPDGHLLYFAWKEEGENRYHLYQHDLAEESNRRVCDAPVLDPRISPDGRLLVAQFFNADNQQFTVGIIPATGGEPQALALPNRFKVLGWARSSEALLCAGPSGRNLDLWEVPLNGIEPRQLTHFTPGHSDITSAAWNATGDSLAVALEYSAFDAFLLEANPSTQ